MLRLHRRQVSEFLDASHQAALANRVTSAHSLADSELSSAEKSSRIGDQWDAFRGGRTSRGTCDKLWDELQAMAFHKCAFCETPHPTTIEHLAPKSSAPRTAFDWGNFLAACGTCNLWRQNSRVDARPFDPSSAEPLDHFGWDEHGEFAPNPAHETMVGDLVAMYGLHRLRGQRHRAVANLRSWLINVIDEDASKPETIQALRLGLTGTTEWLGPVREYLLRPPSEDDALLVRGALMLLPELRAWVEPWLAPPPWAPAWWHPNT